MLDSNTIVIVPTLTANAYSDNGFYDFYKGECNEECLTVPIKETPDLKYSSSHTAVNVFKTLGYPLLTDLALHQNPSLLKDYKKVILLHSEYVTQQVFDAIQSHDNVVYLYPNALYAKVEIIENCKNDICSPDGPQYFMRLIRGHNYSDNLYPTPVANGFDWYYDNSRPYEYNKTCKDWLFNKIDNGYQLNCYPENIIVKNKDLLREIKQVTTRPMDCFMGETVYYPEHC